MSVGFERLDRVLKELLASSPLRRGLEEQQILESWPEIVGVEIAKHSQALGLRDGVLWVRAESSVWAQELSLLRPRIREELEKKLGEGSVKDLRFHTGTGAPPV